jgi:ClpP class serine protease
LAKLFNDILNKGLQLGLDNKTGAARVWYREKAKEIGRVDETSFFKTAGADRYKNSSNFKIGNMYTFYYDPKHKATLPYYDRVPLIFPINRAKGGFLGINFHYLPYDLRAKLMDALYEVSSNNIYDESTKLKISYSILNSSSQYAEFKPTVKHYLFQHIRSRLIYIKPSEWDMALFLNIARFEKASQNKVWADSVKRIKGIK